MEPRDLSLGGAGGLALHALEWSREGVGMLLLHGFGNEAHIWDDFAPVVAPYYRTVALDLRGHGRSAWAGAGGYGLESFVGDLECATEALGMQRLVVVAHSLGGRLALHFASRHPERMAGLVLVDIGPEVDPRGALRIRQDTESKPDPVYPNAAAYARELSLAYPAARSDAIERMARHGLRPRDDGGFELVMDPALRDGGLERDSDDEQAQAEESRQLWQALADLPCPTLVVRGAASDLLSQETADRMVEEVLQNGQLAVIPQAGHSVMCDNPEGFARAVADFALSD